MYKNRAENGALNLCGRNIFELRQKMGLSQRALADRLQLDGLDLDKNAIQKMEAGKRFVTDVELKAFAHFFGVPADALLL